MFELFLRKKSVEEFAKEETTLIKAIIGIISIIAGIRIITMGFFFISSSSRGFLLSFGTLNLILVTIVSWLLVLISIILVNITATAIEYVLAILLKAKIKFITLFKKNIYTITPFILVLGLLMPLLLVFSFFGTWSGINFSFIIPAVLVYGYWLYQKYELSKQLFKLSKIKTMTTVLPWLIPLPLSILFMLIFIILT